MENCCREATVREYIERFGNTELCHDNKEEAKRAVELYVKEKQRMQEEYVQQIKILERQKRVRDIIIHCLVRCVEVPE